MRPRQSPLPQSAPPHQPPPRSRRGPTPTRACCRSNRVIASASSGGTGRSRICGNASGRCMSRPTPPGYSWCMAPPGRASLRWCGRGWCRSWRAGPPGAGPRRGSRCWCPAASRCRPWRACSPASPPTIQCPCAKPANLPRSWPWPMAAAPSTACSASPLSCRKPMCGPWWWWWTSWRSSTASARSRPPARPFWPICSGRRRTQPARWRWWRPCAAIFSAPPRPIRP